MTLEEVARRARVSTATVSRVLNNTATVKSSTRARVLKIVQELKYSPNLHAQSLAGGRSETSRPRKEVPPWPERPASGCAGSSPFW